jgi:hypothetical protein
VLALVSSLAGAVFFLFAVTEEERLSPRVRALVPKDRRLALLAAPFLPGGGRGLLFTMLLLGVAQAIPPLAYVSSRAGLPAPRHGFPLDRMWMTSALVALYVLFFAALGRLIRSRLRPGTVGTWAARLVVPVCVVAESLLPYIPVLVFTGRADRWNPLYILNPVHTIASNYQTPQRPLAIMAVLCLLLLAVNAGSVRRGVAEVLAAARARRERDAPPA